MTTTEVVLLGSTGSIGTQALDVVAAANAAQPGRFAVRALAASGSRPELLAEQVAAAEPELVALADPAAVPALRAALAARGAPEPAIEAGPGAATAAAGLLTGRPAPTPGVSPPAVVLNGITGSVGLRPTLAALRSGATLALANKESLAAGGHVVAAAMVRPGQVVPVDSEHSAMAQALASGRHHRGLTSPVVTGESEVARLVLTASGGPFRGRTRAELASVSAAEALAHPTWAMGPVVTVNSSTLMNKGLELIEASLLFDVPPERVIAVVHPQSVVHSMVEFVDGSTLAQASPPTMTLPIALGLSAPRRLPGVAAPCAWDAPAAWTFEPVDDATFPAIDLARSALAASATHPAVLNAANEVAVERFLAGALPYLSIVELDAAVLAEHAGLAGPSLEDVEAVEAWARSRAAELAGSLAR